MMRFHIMYSYASFVYSVFQFNNIRLSASSVLKNVPCEHSSSTFVSSCVRHFATRLTAEFEVFDTVMLRKSVDSMDHTTTEKLLAPNHVGPNSRSQTSSSRQHAVCSKQGKPISTTLKVFQNSASRNIRCNIMILVEPSRRVAVQCTANVGYCSHSRIEVFQESKET